MPLCLCVEAADEQDLNQSLGLIAEINAEINHLLHEKQMQLKNVRREQRGYTVEAAGEKHRRAEAQKLLSLRPGQVIPRYPQACSRSHQCRAGLRAERSLRLGMPC
jgi:hypothetical protein